MVFVNKGEAGGEKGRDKKRDKTEMSCPEKATEKNVYR